MIPIPTTSYTNSTFSANVIGARTDSSGGAVSDLSAEEARLPLALLSEGYLTPSTAFKVQAQAVPDMTVKVGSGTAKADHYVVAGEVAGQGNYLVRLDVASQDVTIDAADASQARTDEIWLVVRDNTYDASSRGLPQIGYRKGDLGGANPGPDSAWEAAVLLARVAVGAAVTTITDSDITDMRSASSLLSSLAASDHGALSGLGDDDHPQYVLAGAVQWHEATAAVTTSSTTFVGLSGGPTVTVTVGSSGRLLLIWGATIEVDGSGSDGDMYVDFALSGANTRSGSTSTALFLRIYSDAVSGDIYADHGTRHLLLTGLTPGSTTVTVQYRTVSVFPGDVSKRYLTAIPV